MLTGTVIQVLELTVETWAQSDSFQDFGHFPGFHGITGNCSKFPGIEFSGTMQTLVDLLSITGKHFQVAGLRDLCIESGVIAEGSIAGVLDGQKYNRAVRLYNLMYEALLLVYLSLSTKTWQSKITECSPDARCDTLTW